MLNSKDECTHNHEHRVHSISHKADEIDTPHFCTYTPLDKFSFHVPLPVVLTHVLSPLGPVLLLLVVLSRDLAHLAHLLQWLFGLSHVLSRLAPLLRWLVVLSRVLAPPAPLLLVLVVWCWLVALVLSFVLAPRAPLLLLLAVWCWLVVLVLAPPAPLLLLLAVWCWLAWLAMSASVSVGYTPQPTDIFVCRRHEGNVVPTRRRHSVMSAIFLAVGVVSARPIADTHS